VKEILYSFEFTSDIGEINKLVRQGKVQGMLILYTNETNLLPDKFGCSTKGQNFKLSDLK